MPFVIRTMTDLDLPNAEQVLTSAFQRSHGWRSDLDLFRAIQPDGLFLAEQGDEMLGMVAVVIYPAFAYVGLMAVHTQAQHQGIGLALMEHLLAWLERERVAVVELDASPAGQPLYERLGFRVQKEVTVFQRTAGLQAGALPKRVRLIRVDEIGAIARLDALVFGTDRLRVLKALLQAHPDGGWCIAGGDGEVAGYAFSQEQRIGPWVAANQEDAGLLLQAALTAPFPGSISAVVPEENPVAFELLPGFGFQPVRINRHMARGEPVPAGERGRVYSQASLSLG